ncbi:MAG: hypothetical protein WDN10_04110 [bacterium]
MDRQDATTAWIVAGVLAVLLVVALYFWISTRNDLATVLESGKHNIAAQRDQIREDCDGTPAKKEACSQDLADLAAILHDFSVNVETAATTTVTNGQAAQ